MDRAVYVRALLREREGYQLRGEQGRVDDVDVELARHGVAVTPPVPGPAAGAALGQETATVLPPEEQATPPRPGAGRRRG